MDVERIFSRGAKSDEIRFFPRETKETIFLPEFSKSMGHWLHLLTPIVAVTVVVTYSETDSVEFKDASL